MDAAKLALDYIKVLIWPLLLALSFLYYGEALIEILKSREVDAFGLKIGKQVEAVSDNYQAELDALKEQVAQACDGNDNGVLDKIAVIERQLTKELDQVKTTAYAAQAPDVKVSRAQTVEKLEREGFEAILNRDIKLAIDSFGKATELWPSYHNVAEIHQFLKSNQRVLSRKDAPQWQTINEKILAQYTWGMPRDLREKFVSKKDYSR